MITDAQFYSISDRAHFLGAMSFVFIGFIFGDIHWAIFAVGIVIGFATIKEFLVDPRDETAEVAGSGLRDFLGYLAGTIAALTVCLLRTYL